MSFFPYLGFLIIFIPVLYIAIQWPSYYQAIISPVQSIPEHIFLMILIYFTPAWAIFLSFWSLYHLLLLYKSPWFSMVKFFYFIIPLFAIAITIASIHHWHMAAFSEGLVISWFRYYSGSLHLSFISHWSNIFIGPTTLLILIVSLAYYLSRPKMVKNTILIVLFGIFFIVFSWMFIMNYFHWSSELLGSATIVVNEYGEESIFYAKHPSQLVFNIFNPLHIFHTFFKGFLDFFVISRFSASELMPFIDAAKANTDFSINHLRPTLPVLFYTRLVIMLALTGFLSKLHQLHQKI